MTALLLIDIQNDFVTGSLAVPDGGAIVAVVNRLQPKFDLVVATQDWHPAGHGSFAANHPGKRPGDVIDLGGQRQILWPAHCVAGTTGADFVPGFDTTRVEAVIRKGTDPAIDSYSGFFDNGRRKTTGLADYLRGRGVDRVSICGLATDYCVKFTALDAVAEGFAVTLIEDATRGVELTAGDVRSAVERMRSAGVDIFDSGQI